MLRCSLLLKDNLLQVPSTKLLQALQRQAWCVQGCACPRLNFHV